MGLSTAVDGVVLLSLLLLCRRRHHDGLCEHEGLELLGGRALHVAVVEYLVDELVDEHEVGAHTLLAQHAAVVLHHLRQSDEQLDGIVRD